LKEKVLVFKAFLFERESFDLGGERERRSLWSNSFLLGNSFYSLVGDLVAFGEELITALKIKGVQVYL